MPSHKTLQSVANSLAQSFTSLMNYVEDDYVMGHLVFAAWRTGATRLRIDLLRGEAERSELLTPQVRAAVRRYITWFPDTVRRSNSDLEFVRAAELCVEVDPTQRRGYRSTAFEESPFTCSVRIVDDRGKEYSHTITGWWYPERIPPDRA